MAISIKHNADKKYPDFDVMLHAKDGDEPYLTIKGASIRQGANGPFVSWPATKNQQTGKYWNHVWASDAFNAAVMAKAEQAAPKPKPRPSRAEEDDSSIPF